MSGARRLEGWHRHDVLRLLGERTGLVGVDTRFTLRRMARRCVGQPGAAGILGDGE